MNLFQVLFYAPNSYYNVDGVRKDMVASESGIAQGRPASGSAWAIAMDHLLRHLASFVTNNDGSPILLNSFHIVSVPVLISLPSSTPVETEADSNAYQADLQALSDDLVHWATDWLPDIYLDGWTATHSRDADWLDWCQQIVLRHLRRHGLSTLFGSPPTSTTLAHENVTSAIVLSKYAAAHGKVPK